MPPPLPETPGDSPSSTSQLAELSHPPPQWPPLPLLLPPSPLSPQLSSPLPELELEPVLLLLQVLELEQVLDLELVPVLEPDLPQVPELVLLLTVLT